jgi:fucose 4-O-acetylase-like acetyltransferase
VNKLTPFLSNKFKFWAFVSMVLLVFVHGYNLNLRYLQPWTTPDEPLTVTTFIEYLFANGLFRFRIPMLFIISGYLYALHDQTPNNERLGKRVRTLLVPYLIWSALGIALVYAFELFPYTRQLVIDSHVVQIDNERMQVHQYHWYETIACWLFFPVSYQLWFIRVLLFYNIAYPAIRWCVIHQQWRWVFFGFVTLLWLSTAGFIIAEGEGLLFFSLGVWIQKTNFSIKSPARWLKPFPWMVIFLSFAMIKTVLAFKGVDWLGSSVHPIITLLHKFTVVSGLVACWFGLDKCVVWFMKQNWFVWLTSFSFIIYATHAPLVAILINGMFQWLNFVNGYRLIAFALLPMAIIVGSVAIGGVLRTFTPKFYSLLTGGRGV